jgi:hypothetical protein
MVRKLDDCTGGLQDGNASGAPCVRFGLAHALKDGTSEADRGDAPFGRTCDAPAAWTIKRTIKHIAPSTSIGICLRFSLMKPGLPSEFSPGRGSARERQWVEI